jgi:hypothetical protein
MRRGHGSSRERVAHGDGSSSSRYATVASATAAQPIAPRAIAPRSNLDIAAHSRVAVNAKRRPRTAATAATVNEPNICQKLAAPLSVEKKPKIQASAPTTAEIGDPTPIGVRSPFMPAPCRLERLGRDRNGSPGGQGQRKSALAAFFAQSLLVQVVVALAGGGAGLRLCAQDARGPGSASARRYGVIPRSPRASTRRSTSS